MKEIPFSNHKTFAQTFSKTTLSYVLNNNNNNNNSPNNSQAKLIIKIKLLIFSLFGETKFYFCLIVAKKKVKINSEIAHNFTTFDERKFLKDNHFYLKKNNGNKIRQRTKRAKLQKHELIKFLYHVQI